MDIINAVIIPFGIGVISGLVVSFVYLYGYFIRLTPKLVIAEKISKQWEQEGELLKYEIKIINKNRIRSAINVQAQWLLVTLRGVPGPEGGTQQGIILDSERLELKRDVTFQLNKFAPRDDPAQDRAEYAFRFVHYVKKDQPTLESRWTDDESMYLLFRVLATDPLSQGVCPSAKACS